MGSNVTTITGKEKRRKGAEKSKKGAEKRTNGCGEENKRVRRREQMGAEKRKLGAEKRTNGCGEENKWVRRREQLYFGATVHKRRSADDVTSTGSHNGDQPTILLINQNPKSKDCVISNLKKCI